MISSWSRSRIGTRLFSVLAISSAIFATNNCTFAQIVPDNTLGSESSTTAPDPQFPIDLIEGGATRGANLFHSFSEFNVGEGRGAYFYSPSADIQNILARVTGGNPSTILGTIGTYGDSIPNLFLINPNGIIFGPSASLDIGNSGLDVDGTGGSFVATTANAVLLGDTGGIFSASNPIASNLLTVNPSALFFNGTSRAEIVNRATISTSVVGDLSFGLQVPNGRSLLLVGGDVRLDSGNLFVFGGQVELGGVVAGTVGLNVDGNNLSLDYPTQVQRADIVLTNNSVVNVSGSGGGDIAVNARNLDILEQSALYGGIFSGLGAVDTQAGDITLNATGKITIAGRGNDFAFASAVFNTLGSGAIGQSGDINITADSLALNGAGLSNISSGQGNVGNIFIQANNSASFVNSGIFSNVSQEATGKAGNIDIQSQSIFFDGTNLSTGTSGQGEAGNISIQSDLLSLNNSALNTSTSGQGDAGSVFIQATDSVSLAKGSGISSSVLSGGVGQGGSVNIQARSLFLTDESFLTTSTSGQGNGGNVFIQALESVSLANSSILSDNLGDLENIFLGTDGEVAAGNAGNIQISSNSLFLDNDSVLSSNTQGFGNAGNVSIFASGLVSLANSSSISSEVFNSSLFGIEGQNGAVINTLSQAIGNGGDINIEAESLTVDGESSLSTSTFGLGDAGNVSIRTSKLVSLTENSAIISSVLNSALSEVVRANVIGQGKSGDITINTDSLKLDGATLATATGGEGDAGAIFLQANNIFLTGNSRINSAVLQGGVGDAGNIDIKARSLSLTGGSQIRASVQREANNLPGGQGAGGNIQIDASDTIELSGVSADGFSSALSTSTNRGASGQAGDIVVNTTNFRIADGAVVSALTANSSSAGNITINASNFDATGGGQVLTTTSSSGSAGSITLNVTNKIALTGSDLTFANRLAQFGEDLVTNQGAASGLFANTAPSSTGAGGSIFIDPIEFSISDGAGVSVDSLGQGNAGNLQVQASSISLDQGSFLSASTASGEGGNINIQAEDLLLLRRNSNITTAAEGTGNGGNIELDTRFIVASTNEDSNIIADAIAGNGGNIKITTQGIFGIAARPRQTPQSDITASSELGISGEIVITNPDVNPSQGLVALPVETIDMANQIASGCNGIRQKVATNKFVVTGRGGLPANPGNPLASEAVLTDWATLSATENKSASPTNSLNQQSSAPIVEAQGWVIDNRGRVMLTAQAPQTTPNSSKLANTCNY
jgi:filamentous hemagglutinin family protein